VFALPASHPPCSDFLRDRLPYRAEESAAAFAKRVDPAQVTVAFGARALPKLVSLLAHSKVCCRGVRKTCVGRFVGRRAKGLEGGPPPLLIAAPRVSPPVQLPVQKRLQVLGLLQQRLHGEETSAAVELGAVERCVDLLRDADARVRACSAGVIGALSFVAQGRAAARDCGGLGTLCIILTDVDVKASVADPAVSCLRNVLVSIRDKVLTKRRVSPLHAEPGARSCG
jgi:hypothetical protein